MELLDVYDDFGNKTNKVVERGEQVKKLNPDEHIAIGVIFIENKEGLFLIQKTSLEKGGLYSSTGGHVCHNETPLESIKREVLEELGINIDNDPVESLGFLLYDRPIRHIFYLKKDININDICTQKEEVDFVKYMNVDEINKLIDDNMMLASHGILFKKVLEYKNK